MRKLSVLLTVLITLLQLQEAQAQCTIARPAIKLNSTSTNPLNGKCLINLDLYFDMDANAGGKYVFIHIWPTGSYPTLTYSNPPTATNLANSVATIGFYHFSGTLYLLSSYTPDPSIPNFKYTGLTITKSAGGATGFDRFTIQNITIEGTAACTVAQSFTADVWQSQSASAQNVHCFSRGLNFYANDPRLTAFLICNTPREYRFQIKTIDPAGLTVNYKVFIDNGDGIFNATTDNIQIGSGSNIPLDNTNSFTYNSPLLGYLPYSNQKPEADRALWLVVSSPTRDNESYARIENLCAPLPIALGSFNAKRVDNKTELNWTTLSESDNRGFEIQRNTSEDPSQFQTIGFVNSQSPNGNSAEELTYQYEDRAPIKQFALYRIKQIDHSGKFSYSQIRRVNGNSLLNEIYPNPAHDKINLLFNQRNRSYQIEWVNDLGQRLGQWTTRGQIELATSHLPNGVHRIRVRDVETGQTETRTILINHMQ